MKKLKCYNCDIELEADSRSHILDQLYTHYMKDHHEVISGASDQEKKQWMEQFDKDWEAAPEV